MVGALPGVGRGCSIVQNDGLGRGFQGVGAPPTHFFFFGRREALKFPKWYQGDQAAFQGYHIKYINEYCWHPLPYLPSDRRCSLTNTPCRHACNFASVACLWRAKPSARRTLVPGNRRVTRRSRCAPSTNCPRRRLRNLPRLSVRTTSSAASRTVVTSSSSSLRCKVASSVWVSSCHSRLAVTEVTER